MELEQLREKINGVDTELLTLFLDRMALCEEVAACKKAQGLPILNKSREREILATVSEKAGAYEKYAYPFFNTLLHLSKARQQELIFSGSSLSNVIEKALQAGEPVFPKTGVIACQGIEGGNSQTASDQLFPRGKLLYVKNFEAVFDAVESGLCSFGVVPVENSSNGSIRAVYDLLQRKRFFIVRSIRLPIHHELLAKPGATLEGIREVYSHEQALGQCSRFLGSLGDGVRLVPCGNTAQAAKLVSESDGTSRAAVASHACAELYGLIPLREDIQNSGHNDTRFLCIAKEPVIYGGADRICLILSTANTPGALNDVLSMLAVRGVNMSKLESCPVAGKEETFMFFMELEASVLEPGIVEMLTDLSRCCPSFSFLGAYSQV